MRVVFMGTPEFAVPVLEQIYNANFNIVGVFTQPDRARGRRRTPMPPAVKVAAEQLSLPVFQFQRMREEEASKALEDLKPDLCVTAAFGQILSKRNLDTPPLGTINAHASLLPKYRGSAPVNWAILKGETQTGITTMYTDIGVDTGDIILQKAIDIQAHETAGELLARLSPIAAELMVETLHKIQQGVAPRIPQDESVATHYPMLKKEDGKIDFTNTAQQVCAHTLGLDPWPGAFSTLNDENIRLSNPRIVKAAGKPGQILKSNDKDGLIVACKTDAVRFLHIQAPGKRCMNDTDYLRGNPIEEGTFLNNGC